jgi:2-polyprenyl-3-methyl-5-hydroxy-6-metoxy-1,4-benzoquinol methylase
MPFDERLVLNNESKTNIIYDEHLVRYKLAAQLAAGKKVLDIACGSGYGSKILAEAGAEKVVAIDVDAEAVAEAKKKYTHANLEFRVGDAEKTLPVSVNTPRPSATPLDRGDLDTCSKEGTELFDLVVSFETIEHLKEVEKYLAEIARVLALEGIFLVSTPNREVFGQKNPFHLHEFTRGEFEETLKKHFKNIFILEQTNGIASLIKAGNSGSILLSDSAAKSLYFIAICSNNSANLSELFKESVVSVNPAALERIKNNPVMRFADKIYSLIKR